MGGVGRRELGGTWAGEEIKWFGEVEEGGCEGVLGRGRCGELLGSGSFV